jgi:ketosteroid isomerase-like protein
MSKLSVIGFVGGVVLLIAACATQQQPMKRDLTDFGRRYAAAWSSQNPAQLASFYAEDGSLIVNNGAPSTGRAAIAAKAQSFMTAFPDMLVTLERMDEHGDHPVFRWIWTGTNTGPGGTGKFVRITGYEEWTLNSNGLIAKSDGHYDEAEYQRQLKVGAPLQP